MTNQIQMIEGFLHAYLLDGKGGGRSLTWLEVAEWRASNDKSALWLHLDYTDSAVQEWVTQQSGLDPIISQALLTEETRPRVTAVEDGLLMALRGVNLNPDSDPEDMVSIRIWADKNWVVSTRKRKLLSTQDILTKLQRGLGPKNTADLIVQLADGIVWRMSDTVELLEDKMDGLEDRSLTEDHSNVRFELATLRRQTISLRRYLSPQKEALARLLVESVSWLDQTHQMKIHEVSDRLIRHLENIDSVRERAGVAHEELLSRVSEQLNARMYVLSVLSAIFLPLSFFTGLLGVNVSGIPGAESPYSFMIFVAILFVIVFFQIWLFKRKRWL